MLLKSFNLILFILLLCSTSVRCLWEFGVTTKSKILFYDDQWREVTTAAHQFDQLSAITFDDSDEVIYFNDHMHDEGSIFSLKIPYIGEKDAHTIENVVARTQNESIAGVAYDPLNRNIFWTDAKNKKIYFASVDAPKGVAPKVLLDFVNEDTIPDGIAIDICRRKLYWTNSNFRNASIERVSLDGNEREQIIRSDLFLPHGIVVDQMTDRIFWVVDQEDIYFSIESAYLNGTDRKILVKGINNLPFNLAVTKNSVYWTDLTHGAVWSISKLVDANDNSTSNANTTTNYDTQPIKVKSFSEHPRGIVARTRYLKTLQNDEHCKDVVAKLKNRLLKPKPTKSSEGIKMEKKRQEFCLNGGEYSNLSGMCVCRIGYDGARCETNECQNFCVHGTCSMSSMGFPQCTCQQGFYGERCQSYKCSGYCLNNGRCSVEHGDETKCDCRDGFVGSRCERNSTEICSLMCRILKYDPEAHVPFVCLDICEKLANSEGGANLYAIPQFSSLKTTCNSSLNATIITLVIGVCVCLLLVFLIVHGVRRLYKPARPRIKKTFVVQKKMSQTPLTSRPIATEQCEITIENCCNMNICDTPCFDPKLLQQNLSQDTSKDDKKVLIHHMDDDLY